MINPDSKQEKKEKVTDLIHILNRHISNKKQSSRERYDSLILGNGPQGTYSMDPQKSVTNNNVMVISSTNGGKTTSIVEPNILHAEHQSMVVLITKSRILNQYKLHLKKRGYDVKVLDFVNPHKSDLGYDPLRHIKDDSDVRFFTKHIVAASGCSSPKDPYWETSPASLLSAFVKLARHKFGPHASMNDVIELFHYIDVEEKDELDDETGEVLKSFKFCPTEDFERYRELDPNMYLDWNQYRTNHPHTAACIQGILSASLGNITGNDICRLMNMDKQIDFRSLVNRKTILFIVTNPVNTAHHPFANLILGSMFKELFEYAESRPDGRLPIPLTVICDDFATGGRIPNFQQHISIFREQGISVMMLVQSFSQLAAMYDENGAKTIIDNTDNLVYMGGNDLDTAAQISYRINKPIDEVLTLPIGEEYLFRRGQTPLKLRRYQIYDDPLYQQKIAPQAVSYLR